MEEDLSGLERAAEHGGLEQGGLLDGLAADSVVAGDGVIGLAIDEGEVGLRDLDGDVAEARVHVLVRRSVGDGVVVGAVIEGLGGGAGEVVGLGVGFASAVVGHGGHSEVFGGLEAADAAVGALAGQDVERARIDGIEGDAGVTEELAGVSGVRRGSRSR